MEEVANKIRQYQLQRQVRTIIVMTRICPQRNLIK